ncbi:hypothetical protein BGZ92_008026 [Podila epicladia]|nr:hypothetical protein BGZ92_008026 [Podila epicladia]
MLPGSDFIGLLRVLRPVDHAFFITLFVNQIPQDASEDGEEERQQTTKTPNSPNPSPKYIKDHRVCGSWIQEYIEFQSKILKKSLPVRYTIHACSKYILPANGSGLACNDMFSQMVAMTSAFAWSVMESRGFFLRPDQVHGLQESFQSALLNHWTVPPKTDSAAKVDTEDLTTRDLEALFKLQDPLFESSGVSALESAGGLDDEQMLKGIWSMRSLSRNRVTFERTLLPSDAMPPHLQQLVSTSTSTPLRSLDSGQQRLGQKLSVPKMKKLMNGLEQDGVELILFQDLLPQFVNTTRTLKLFLELGLPLPDRIIQQNKEHIAQEAPSKDASSPSSFIRGGSFFPHFSHSSHAPGSSSKVLHQSLSAAFHAAVYDESDISRIHSAPKTFGCLLDILIQPHLLLQRLIHPYATLFQLPAVFSVGIYIKPQPTSTGTTVSWKTVAQDRKVLAERYLTCARQIAREFAPKRKGQKVIYVVVSEDAKMATVMEAQETWDEEVITPRWHSKPPPPPTAGTGETKKELISKTQYAVLDNWILSKTDYQVVSDHSDFAKVAVWRTRRAGRSIVVREQERAQDYDPGFVDMLDCGALLRNGGVDE